MTILKDLLKKKEAEIKKKRNEIREIGMLRDERSTAGGREISCKYGVDERRGKIVETAKKGARLSLSVRATRLAVAARRSIDVATSVVAHAHIPIYLPLVSRTRTDTHALSLSVSLSPCFLFLLLFVSPHLPAASPLRTRGWNY